MQIILHLLIIISRFRYSLGNLKRMDMKSLQKYIPENYDKSLPPFSHEDSPSPMKIQFSIKPIEIQNVDEQNMEITVQWFVRVIWKDARLVPPLNATNPEGVNLDPRILDVIWLPSTYVEHASEITSPTLLVEPRMVKLYPNGHLLLSSSKITRLSCPMEFSAYPFDTQTCYFMLHEYRFSEKYVIYEWSEEIELGEMSKHPQFSFQFNLSHGPGILHAGHSYPYVSVQIILRRSITNHLLNTYFLSTLLVVVSWLSFLIPPTQVPGRMVLSVTTLLTLMSMFSAVRKEGPQVSYAKAIDQWMLTCLFFVFLALIEFTIVVYLKHKAEKQSKIAATHLLKPKHESQPYKEPKNNYIPYEERAHFLEKWTWIILLLIFLVFACVYWVHWYAGK